MDSNDYFQTLWTDKQKKATNEIKTATHPPKTPPPTNKKKQKKKKQTHKTKKKTKKKYALTGKKVN